MVARVLSSLGRIDEANEHYAQLAALHPDLGAVWTEWGSSLARAGRLQEASEKWLHALSLRRDATTHARVARAFWELGRQREALRHAIAAVELAPRRPAARIQLAWIFATIEDEQMRDPVHAERLIAPLVGDDAGAHELDVLAAVYASAARFDDAVATADRAIELASAAHRDALAREIAARRDLYASSRPYVTSAADASKAVE
jgi:tetratricopeptide (TPR) repeat protein